jgi:Zn-dependent protease with chaperone function
VRLEVEDNSAIFEDIELYRRGIRRGIILVLLPYLVTISIACALLILSVVVHGTSGTQMARSQKVLPSLVVFAVLLAAPAALTWLRVSRGLYMAGRDFRLLENYPGPTSYDRQGYSVFTNALDGVSMAAGIDRPDLRLLDDPGLNALTYTDRFGQNIILLTAGALVSDISTEEKNSLVAHEVAHVMIGDILRKPSVLSVEFIPDVLLLALVAIGIVTLALPGYDAMRLVLAGLIIIAVLALYLAGRSRASGLKRRALAHHHDDIFADTIAAKLTSNPQALFKTIQRVHEDMLRRRMQYAPGGLIAAYLFAGPKELTDRELRNLVGLDSEMFFTASDADAATPEGFDQNIAERMANLTFIQQGRRPSVEAWSVD